MRLRDVLLSSSIAWAVGTSVATATSSCPDQDVRDMTVQDVQDLLSAWSLDHAFGEQFAAQKLDGYLFRLLSKGDANPDVYPDARPVHWEGLWSRMADCGIGKGFDDEVAATRGGDDQSATSTHNQRQRRQLASSSSGGGTSGIHVKSPNSSIALGPQGDVLLSRVGNNTLRVVGNVVFMDNVTFASASMDSGSSSSCECKGYDELLEWQAKADAYLSALGLGTRTVSNCNNATLDGYYMIDTNTAVSPFLAKCSQDDSGNWWMDFLLIRDDYAPTSNSFGSPANAVSRLSVEFRAGSAWLSLVVSTGSCLGSVRRLARSKHSRTRPACMYTSYLLFVCWLAHCVRVQVWFLCQTYACYADDVLLCVGLACASPCVVEKNIAS